MRHWSTCRTSGSRRQSRHKSVQPCKLMMHAQKRIDTYIRSLARKAFPPVHKKRAIMKMLRKIVRTGLTEGQEYREKRAILLSNYISLTLSGALLTLFLIRRVIFGDVPGGVMTMHLVVGIVAFSSPLILNGVGRTTLARFVLCCVPIVYLWWVYISLMKQMPFVASTEYDSCRIFFARARFHSLPDVRPYEKGFALGRYHAHIFVAALV